MMRKKTIRWTWTIVFLSAVGVHAGDWPTYRHDNRRSGWTAEPVSTETLHARWVWQSPVLPQPAWAGPAKWDAYANIRGLRSMRDYDAVFHVVAASDCVWFGSSADDTVRCLDAETGREKWSYTAGGAVRIAPTYADGRLYFGSDDGFAYCLQAGDGRLVWKVAPGSRQRLILNNGRPIPQLPCRSGVLVDAGTAYFADGMLPWEQSYLCAVDARTGKVEGNGRYIKTYGDKTMEGALLASEKRLYVPQGRVPPLVLERSTGAIQGALKKGGGGSFVLLTNDELILHGPGNKTGWITQSRADTREQVTSFPDADAMVVTETTIYLSTDYSLAAIDRATRKKDWTIPLDCPHDLILAGDVLFAGGADTVAAIDAKTGELLWRGIVSGRADGLAVADGALLVSTDAGAIYCFRGDTSDDHSDEPRTRRTITATGGLLQQGRPAAVEDAARHAGAGATAEQDSTPVAPVKPVEDSDLVGRWVFHKSQMKGVRINDLAGQLPGTIQGPVECRRIGNLQALVMDGAKNVVELTDDYTRAHLPRQDITVEAWVRIDQALTWGGIVGAMQDNGDYERGWLLGYRDRRFCFAVAAGRGNGRLTYLPADEDFQLGGWYHVAGTYDGEVLTVYVNGRQTASSQDQKGSIQYPPQAYFDIGAYHDKNEFYGLRGMLHEVRIYRRALSDDEIRQHVEAKEANWPAPVINRRRIEPVTLAVGPCLQFVDSTTANVRWETAEPSPTRLTYRAGAFVRVVGDPKLETRHKVQLTGLCRNTAYEYSIEAIVDGKTQTTAPFECDTFFNYSLPAIPERPCPYSTDDATMSTAASQLLRSCGVDRGICVLLGCDDGRLVYELARRSQLRMIGLATDGKRVATDRKTLLPTGLYGSRTTILQVDSLEKTALSGCLADVVIATRPGLESESLRLARPGGAVFLIASNASPAATSDAKTISTPQGTWRMLRREQFSDAGVWTHQYGLPDNSAFGGETLDGATGADELLVQWIGRPGPRAQADRNGRKPSPLAINGRLFMQGLHRMIALNAYNGSILWSLEIPHFQRFNIPRDCSNWCADDRHVFAAVGNTCWQIDATDGSVSKRFDVVAGPRAEWTWDWSYIARPDAHQLIGSAVRAGTSWTGFWGKTGWYDARTGPVTNKICSDNLFALVVDTGRRRWVYSKGLVLNSTITIAGGRVYFVESRNANIAASDSRRVEASELWQDQYLVALDLATGHRLWQQPLDTADGTVVFYLACAEGKLVLAASVAAEAHYHVYAWETGTGKPVWHVDFPWPHDDKGRPIDNHGRHMSRPAIVAGRVFVRPAVIDLATGKQLETTMPLAGCGTYALTAHTAIYRSRNVTLWDFRANKASGWNRLRPGCWLSTIPACGMLLSPEAGGGCSCGSWLETSVGFIPKSRVAAAAANGPP